MIRSGTSGLCHDRTYALQENNVVIQVVHAGEHQPFAERDLWNTRVAVAALHHSALIPVNFTTLPHFSVSSAMSLPKSPGEPKMRAAEFGKPRLHLRIGEAALISLLSLSMISAGVFRARRCRPVLTS